MHGDFASIPTLDVLWVVVGILGGYGLILLVEWWVGKKQDRE